MGPAYCSSFVRFCFICFVRLCSTYTIHTYVYYFAFPFIWHRITYYELCIYARLIRHHIHQTDTFISWNRYLYTIYTFFVLFLQQSEEKLLLYGETMLMLLHAMLLYRISSYTASHYVHIHLRQSWWKPNNDILFIGEVNHFPLF